MKKAEDRCHNDDGKKKLLNIILLIKRFEIGNKYRNLFQEEKEAKRENNKKKNKLEEYQRNHQALRYYFFLD